MFWSYLESQDEGGGIVEARGESRESLVIVSELP
jgi:hypothetical protein